MRGPPDGQKEREQQAIQMSRLLNPAGLDVPTAAFAVLKGGFHAHAPGIFLNLSTPSSLITDEQPRFLTAFVPHQAHVGFQHVLLPHAGLAIPAIAWLEDDLPKTLPRLFQFSLEVTPTGMLLTKAQQIVPLPGLTQLHQRHAG